jgi:cytochrome c oxidase subunit IV
MTSPESHHGQTTEALSAEAQMGAVHEHPTWSTYWKIATILTAITVFEVWCYYLPSFPSTPYFVPTLLLLSLVKFWIVVMFYMHLKYDAKLFRALFVGPLLVASLTILALLLLFGKMAIRLGLLT